MNIYEKLLKITDELDTVAKKLTVGVGKSAYKGVGEADVLSAVKPLEVKYGVYSYPMDREMIYAEAFTGEKAGYKPTDPPKRTYKFVIRLKTTYRFVNVNEPSEYVDQVVFSDGEDPMDKAPGKAMTYGDKYALLKAYKIITGDDPDQNHSNDTTPTNMKKYTKPPKKQHSTLGNLSEAEAFKQAVDKGMENIEKLLVRVDNFPYRDEVIKNVCGIYGWKEWTSATFKDNHEFSKLMSIVRQEISKEKDLAMAGA
jgi:hypothetical protein